MGLAPGCCSLPGMCQDEERGSSVDQPPGGAQVAEGGCKGVEAGEEATAKGAGKEATVQAAEAGEEAATGAEASKEATAKGAGATTYENSLAKGKG